MVWRIRTLTGISAFEVRMKVLPSRSSRLRRLLPITTGSDSSPVVTVKSVFSFSALRSVAIRSPNETP